MEFVIQAWKTKIILDQHYNASYNETLFTCNICEYSFSQKGNLKLYVESVQEGKKPTKNDREKHVDLVHEKRGHSNVKFATNILSTRVT